MRKISIAFFIVIFIIGCDKKKDNDVLLQVDTLKQFVEYELYGTKCIFSECDTLKVYPKTNASFSSLSDSITIYYRSEFQMAIKYNGGASYEYLDILFYNKILKNPDNVLYDYTIGYQNLFNYFNKKWYFLDINCDSVIKENKVSIFSELSYNSTFAGWSSTYFSMTDACDFMNYRKDNTNSNIELTRIDYYKHKVYGDCILLEGQFEVDLINSIVGNELKNGRFKILLSEATDYYGF